MTPAFVEYVERRFASYMAADYPSVAVFFENPPEHETYGEFAVCHVLAAEDVEPVGLGIDAKSRNVGVVHLAINVKPEIGAGRAQDIAKFMGRIFRRVDGNVADEGNVVFKDPRIISRGEVNGRYRYIASIPYRYDFVETTVT